jgi:hypothetical protein
MHKLASQRSDEEGIEHHVDHVVTLSRGGLHHHLNMQVITAAENRSKGARLPPRLAAALLVVAMLTGCASATVGERRASAVGCAAALFLGPVIGLPIAIGCALSDVEEEEAAQEELDV